jgi:hypothetical protein
MFDTSTISKRYFPIKLTVTGDDNQEHCIELEVEPPKMKTLKKLVAIKKEDGTAVVGELNDVVGEILSKNKSGYKVPQEYVESLDYEQIAQILDAYFSWLNQEKNSPN